MTPLTEWQNFYVIVGSSAGALTGLQFVVMALVADLPSEQASPQSVDAFGTPTIVHFGAVLLFSALISAPWGALRPAMLVLTGCGAIGLGYVAIVARRARRQRQYAPVFEDWVFHVILPAVAYGMLAASSAVARFRVDLALFAVGTAALLLLFIGIHNAWDTVTFLIFHDRKPNGGAG